MARDPKKFAITIQNIEPELWEKIEEFLNQSENKKMRGKKGPLALAALESYLELAEYYGIDSEWHLRMPTEANPLDPSPEGISKQQFRSYLKLADAMGKRNAGKEEVHESADKESESVHATQHTGHKG